MGVSEVRGEYNSEQLTMKPAKAVVESIFGGNGSIAGGGVAKGQLGRFSTRRRGGIGGLQGAEGVVRVNLAGGRILG